MVSDLSNVELVEGMVTESTNNEVGSMKRLLRYHKHLSFTCIVTIFLNIKNLIHLLPHSHASSLTNTMFHEKIEMEMKLLQYLFLTFSFEAKLTITSHKSHSSARDYWTSVTLIRGPVPCY